MPKLIFTCLDKIELASKIYLLKFGADIPFEYKPGQFISLEVAPKTLRSYSMMSYVDKKNEAKNGDYVAEIEFLVNTRSGGEGSQAVEKMQINDNINAIGPLGKFALVQNDKPKIFVATGTGLGPFVGMIKQVLESNPNTSIHLFFGVYSSEFDFCHQFFTNFLHNPKYPNFKIITCADALRENEVENDSLKLGQVTTVIPQFIHNYLDFDFYICGNPFMVTATEQLLIQSGATDNIYTEKYSSLPKNPA